MHTFHRPRLSSYFPRDFPQREISRLQSLPQVRRVSSLKERPNILITDTHFRGEELPDHIALIVHPNSGHDNFSADSVRRFPGHIVTGNSIRAEAVVQYILGCLLQKESYRGPGRSWPRSLLGELKVAIIGLGHIGSLLHKTLENLGTSCALYDPYKNLPAFLPRGDEDAVVLCCSKNPHNSSLIDAAKLRALPEHVAIINPARAELIAEKDLADFLAARPQAAAYLDVVEQAENFTGLSNAFVTPHVAGVFRNIDRMTLDFEYQVIKEFVTDPARFEESRKPWLLKSKLRDDYLI